MVVFASPIYYFSMTTQMEAATAQFKAYMGYAGIEAAGIITAHGDENKSEAKLNEIKDFAKGL